MPSDSIQLFVITRDEEEAWLKKVKQKAYSPRHDQTVTQVAANQVSEKAGQLPAGVQIWVDKSAAISDVIAEARRWLHGYREDFVIYQKNKKGKPYRVSVEYGLFFPALREQKLENEARISDFGLASGDLIVIGRWAKESSLPLALIAGVSSFDDFQKVVWASQDPDDPMLLSVLLYTDADVELARYVREHFDELHRMSGPRLITYVIERRPQVIDSAGALFWRAQLDSLVYRAWTLLGWTRSKPYDKSEAYEIARKIGIYPDRLPCLAVFDKTGEEENIVFPIRGDLTDFFRKTYSNIQHAIHLGPAWNIPIKTLRDRERRKLFNRIRESLTEVSASGEGLQSVYNFYGQTVFINQPSGSVHIRDFQNISGN